MNSTHNFVSWLKGSFYSAKVTPSIFPHFSFLIFSRQLHIKCRSIEFLICFLSKHRQPQTWILTLKKKKNRWRIGRFNRFPNKSNQFSILCNIEIRYQVEHRTFYLQRRIATRRSDSFRNTNKQDTLLNHNTREEYSNHSKEIDMIVWQWIIFRHT